MKQQIFTNNNQILVSIFFFLIKKLWNEKNGKTLTSITIILHGDLIIRTISIIRKQRGEVFINSHRSSSSRYHCIIRIHVRIHICTRVTSILSSEKLA